MTHERGADLLFRRFVVGIFVIILGFLIFLLFTSKGWEGQAKPNESASSTDPAGGNSSFGLEDRLAGQWYSVTGPRMSLTFEKGGGLKLVLYATGGVSFDMNSSGSYTVTGSRAFTILEGGEYSDGRLEGDELAITKRGDLTSRFRKN